MRFARSAYRCRWTQWIFLQIFKQGLAYQAEVPVNWCPALGTVLANEEVIGASCLEPRARPRSQTDRESSCPRFSVQQYWQWRLSLSAAVSSHHAASHGSS